MGKRESHVGARSIQEESYFIVVIIIIPLACGF